jgi:hypothetical protein
MNREGAEAHVRLLAEAELHRAADRPGHDGATGSDRLSRAGQVLTAVGAAGQSAQARALVPVRWQLF